MFGSALTDVAWVILASAFFVLSLWLFTQRQIGKVRAQVGPASLTVEKELKPNGGSSMYDKVNKLVETVDVVVAHQETFNTQLAALHDRMDGLEDAWTAPRRKVVGK